MKHLILTTALCLSLTACETMSDMEWPSLNPFVDDAVTQVETAEPAPFEINQSTIETELDEMELLTGERMRVQGFINEPEPIEMVKAEVQPVIAQQITEAMEPIKTQNIADLKAVEAEAKAKMLEAELEKQAAIVKQQKVEITEKVEMIETKAMSGCPAITIVPSAKSLTNFETNMSGQMTSRASITDVRGGCEIVNGGMEIDLDILMRGTITNKGRFEGKVNEEAFVTFPYFVSVIKPDGNPIDKRIMATAMRFRPSVDYLEHAEKITQFVPMDDAMNSGNYQIMVGYQLTRKQMEYNRLANAARPNDKRASPDTSQATRKSYNPLSGE